MAQRLVGRPAGTRDVQWEEMPPEPAETPISPPLPYARPAADAASGGATGAPPGRLRTLVTAFLLGAVSVFLTGVYLNTLLRGNGVDRDYIEYWAQGQLLGAHGNPYDPAAILRVERQAGYPGAVPRFSYSPPVALPLVLPLGYCGARTGLLLWLLAEMTCLILSVRLLWILNGRSPGMVHLLAFAFPPVIACLMAGQLSLFFLLGLVLFLSLHRRHPWLAGAFLMPFALKPHLILPFAVALAVWVALRRAYAIVGGFAIALAASCAASVLLDGHAWMQYRAMMKTTGVLDIFIPALAVQLRFLVDRNAAWIQFLPEAGACLWAAWYAIARRASWDWTRHGLLVLLAGAVCTPYGWFYDDALQLPAVLFGVYCALQARRTLLPLALAMMVALIEVLAKVSLYSPWYLWTTPAWLAWYLYSTRARLDVPARG